MGKNSASNEAKKARQDEEARQKRIREGTASINKTFDEGFNDKFFQGLQDSYVNFARPDLDKQVGEARGKLTASLARSGLLDSSVRVNTNAKLDQDYNKNLLDITDKARGQATEARTNVERSRADLISLLQATGDNVGAANAALSRASILSTPPAYSPLGQLFQDYTAGLAQQAALERAEALGFTTRNGGSASLFRPSSSAVTVR